MLDTRVKTSLIVENQLPAFVQDEFPLVSEFLKQYYISLESQGNVSDILQNIDQYVKVDTLTNLNDSTTLRSNVSFFDTSIVVDTTYGFPEKYGLLKIDDEIITYTSKTSTSFEGCVRGFSGVTSLKDPNNVSDLVFNQSLASEHTSGSIVSNLSVLFLKEFFKKVKTLVTPGFEDISFDSDLSENIFIKQSRDFYTSKGTDESFKILFGALYGENVNVIKPRDFLIRPSDSQYRIVKDLVIEKIQGDPFTLLNRTIFQSKQQNIESAYGSVSNVQVFNQNNKDYYILSLDYDYNKDINVVGSVYGNFSIHPKTKLLTEAQVNQSFIDVDSTVGFPNSGSLVVYLKNGTSVNITYTSKSLNQFLGCSGISQVISEESEIKLDVYASNYETETTNEDLVKFNITGVLSDFNFDPNGKYYSEGDEIYIKGLGKRMSEQKYKSFLYNISVDYDIDEFRFEGNDTNLKYSFKTFDENVINIGDRVLLRYVAKFPSGFQQFINKQIEEVVIVRGINIPKKEFSTITSYQVIDAFSVKRLLSKSDFENYPDINGFYNTNVSNTYVDNEGSMYVSASSLPSYERSIQTKEKSVTFGGIFEDTRILVIKDHGFYTGDAVKYSFTDFDNKIINLEEKKYYVERLDADRIKLYNSLVDIYTTKYSNTSIDRSIILYSLTPSSNQTNTLKLFDVSSNKLENSKIIRKFSTPTESKVVEETKPGFTGLFVNGVEILNYKSKDSIYYGPIESIDVIDSGTGYDVINPPRLEVQDVLGYGATANINVSGSLERIEIIDQGHDYLEKPIITIKGGNGIGAVAEANLVSYDHIVTFNASQFKGSVDLSNDTISFSTYHRFRDYENVVYETYGQSSLVGLTTGATYCVKIINSNTVRLFKDINDATLGINTVGISSLGQGIHSLISTIKKKRLGSIEIVNQGSNYSYRKNTIYSSGISTSKNIIFAKNHGYSDGEILNYSYTNSPIGGLSSTSYYVKVLNDSEFMLSEIGYGSTEKDFYYRTNQFINLTSAPSGHHTFNYPPIEVTISGRSGVSTFIPGNQNAIINPIFRGSVTSVSLASTTSAGSNIGGIGYGSKDIINLIQQPNFRILSGSGAQLTPIISDGRIVEVIVENEGSNYNSTPDLEIIGSGLGATLTPIISNGRIKRIVVVNSGIGYTSSTFINVKSSGSGLDLFARIKEWNINIFEKESFVEKEAGIITKSLNEKNLQYAQVYLPENLRKIVFSQVFFAGDIKYISDFNNELNNTRKNHSPIIGWAYDGNPIYGPYGYSDPLQSITPIKKLESGYVRNTNLQNDPNRPPFDVGFFTNDYVFKGTGDLDEHNGRYCVTPEYPNGIYAYFCTFDPETGLPVFPYIIGNSYKNSPIQFNFNPLSNEEDFDFNESDLKRNTYPYNLNLKNSRYPYIFNSNTIKSQVSKIKHIFPGSIDSVGIETGGNGYRIGDNILFNNEGTDGFGSSAFVSSIKGVEVDSLSYSLSSLSNIEFINYNNSESTIAICTSPHGFGLNEIVSISGLSTTNKSLFETYQIKPLRSSFRLSTGIGSTSVTGIITYFNVLNSLNFPEIIENDVLGIGTEKVKVLSVDAQNSRIKVLRCFDNTIGSSYSAFNYLFEYPRKFLIDNTEGLSNNYRSNREYYFNPVETLGIGTQSGVGIGTILYFSNPGAGVTSKFVPSKTLYFKNHNLNTGDVLIYSSNSGTPISVSSDGSNIFQLQNQTTLYVAKIDDDLIGISTFKVGLSTSGNFVGIESSRRNQSTLFLTSVGSGTNHSFRTNYDNVLTGSVNKIVSTITTKNPHNLNSGDSIDLKVLSGVSTSIKVSYNDENSRAVFDPRSFVELDINSTNNTIRIINHPYITGEKIIHTSSSPVSGLENNGIYYVVVVDKDTIKLSRSYYQSLIEIPETIDLISSSGNVGTLYKVNPLINAYRNQNVVFDLSDTSLSFSQNSQRYSAFKIDFYTDKNFINKLNTKNITQIGEAGLSGSSLILKIDNSLPEKIYYKLTPFNPNRSIEVSSLKQSIVVDSENIVNNNTILIKDSNYSGSRTIIGVTTFTASFALDKIPENNNYTSASSNISYSVISGVSTGPINSIEILNKGKNYNSLPSIQSIQSEFGSGAILFPESNTIGKIKSVSVIDYGFDYSVDKTIDPQSSLPSILKVDPLNSIDRIDVVSIGNNYTSPPNLILIDTYNNKVIEDVELDFSIKNRSVSVLKNTNGIYSSKIRIVPINNSNGMKIKNIGFNTTTKDVTVTLDVGFLSGFSTTTDFPFLVGDKILIENTSVSSGSTGTIYRGYNSEDYDYELFTIKSTDPNIGGVNPSIVFNVSNYYSGTDNPGTFNPLKSSGRIVAEKDFPVFNSFLKKNEFIVGESVTSNSIQGKVQKFDGKNNYVKISSKDDFEINQELLGKTSGSKAIIVNILSYASSYDINSTSIVNSGSKKETGFLNNNNQRTHDSDYYQYFSYSLRSKVPYDKWSSSVDSLNHTSGFKKFSDLVIESKPTEPTSSLCLSVSGICTNQNFGSVITTADIISEADLNCVYDFDLAFENSIDIGNKIVSDSIRFNSRIIQDYIEASGNVVLSIDDISSLFDDTPRVDIFSVVDNFDLTRSKYKKYFILIEDNFFDEIKQLSIVSLLHDESTGFINQYGNLNTFDDLGSFDFRVFGTSGQLLFYPTYSSINDYNLSFITYDIDNVVGVGSTTLGDIVKIEAHYSELNVGYASTSIVSISSSFRSSKVLVEISSVDSLYNEIDEITLIHDGTNVYMTEYGQLDTDLLTTQSIIGIGTYNAYISGNELIVDLIPNVAITTNYTINSSTVSIGNTESTGIGTYRLPTGQLKSDLVYISSSLSPVENVISTLNNSSNGAYCLVSVEDTTNDQYLVSELLVVSDGSNAYIADFGNVETNSSSGIGTFSASVSGTNLNINFTPNQNIDVQVRTFTLGINRVNLINAQENIDFGSLLISSDFGFYTGTENDVRKSFYLTHNNLPVFHRYFDGSNIEVVDIDNNIIKIADHFFRSGEKITYYYDGYQTSTENAIGIGTTYINVGVGTTNKLPRELYVVKIDNYSIKLASTAENALKLVPEVLNLTSVGIGTNHKFVTNSENRRVLISIDNMIQSPLVSTATTTTILQDIGYSDTLITLSNVLNIFPENLLKINDEILKVSAVGVGSTNIIRVQRRFVGSELNIHNANTLISKVEGSYNIVDNTINFIDPPYGPSPIGTITNYPDERDYTGITTYSRFNGRVFFRSSAPNSSNDPYEKNYIFDDISHEFSGIKSDFALKVDRQNIIGISSSNTLLLVNGIFQGPENSDISPVIGNYYLEEKSGITSVYFKGSGISTAYDINTSGLPIGGIIVSVGSTAGFGYQPLVSAGGTAIVSVAGTIQSISIGNSGSGYRSGVQIVNVGVTTSSLETPNVEYIGTASISNGHVVSVAVTNPGAGYTSSNPPIVIFDSPLSYENIPLIYSSSSSGIGTESRVNVVVGQGSSVIDFEIINDGYNYRIGDILTLPIGGATGIPTDPSKPFNEFKIFVDKVFNNRFSAWSVGDIQILDDFSNEFNGVKKSFQLKLDNRPISILAAKNSKIDLSSTLIVFINDILQVPGESYIFNGGSIITFNEAPKSGDEFWDGDTIKIYFYRGTSSVDTKDIDILETVKVGDDLQLYGSSLDLIENERSVDLINSSNSVITNTYSGPGISTNEFLNRPVIWCRQTQDRVINGKVVGKDREIYEPNVEPVTNIIQNVGIGTTIIFVQSVRTFFDNERENVSNKFISKIKIISQDTKVGAYATAIVSDSGTISYIDLINPGVGYTISPNIIVSSPTGIGSTAIITASISNGSIIGISTISAGSSYTQQNPPSVLIESPFVNVETIENITYDGDFGIISGISTGSIVGVASTALIFDLLIESDSFLRDPEIVGTAVTISGIQNGYYFITHNTNIGYGVTSLDESNSVVGVGTTFLDNLYKVASVSIASTNAAGIGVTYVAKVVVSVASYNGLTGIGYSNYYGDYSWGRITFPSGSRPDEKTYTINNQNGVVGLETSALIRRYNPLRYFGYST